MRERFLVLVVLVLRLLRHRERAGQRDLDLPVGVSAQELDVATSTRRSRRIGPTTRGTRNRRAGAVDGAAGILDVDAVERGREAVGVAFAADLAVGDDVDAGALLSRIARSVASSCACSSHASATRQISGARTPAAPSSQLGAIDQPVRLRIAADDGGGEEAVHGRHGTRGRPDLWFASIGGLFIYATLTCIEPMRSIVATITSPGRTGPTPCGVPVRITSPGCSV